MGLEGYAKGLASKEITLRSGGERALRAGEVPAGYGEVACSRPNLPAGDGQGSGSCQGTRITGRRELRQSKARSSLRERIASLGANLLPMVLLWLRFLLWWAGWMVELCN